MHGNGMAGAIAALAASINDALVDGRPTAEMRQELARLEQQQRREAAEAAQAERDRRAAAEAEEQARVEAAAAALVVEAEARLASRMATLAVPPAPVVRRTPQGIHIMADPEVRDE